MERAEIIKIIRAYATENIAMCGDSILLDPVLRGEGFSPDNVATSEELQIHSTIHSAKYHAAKDFLHLIGENTDDL